MSLKTVTICDCGTAAACSNTAADKCALCDRDACSFHYGTGYALVTVAFIRNVINDPTHGGHERVRACDACMLALTQAGPVRSVGTTEMLRARLSEISLKEQK